MRYLVHFLGKNRKFYFWEEEEKTHISFACENNIDLEKVSSVVYILYNPEIKKWILSGAISWTEETNVNADKRIVMRYIKENFEKDDELKNRLTEKWSLTQQKNAEILKKNPFFASAFKTKEKVRS